MDLTALNHEDPILKVLGAAQDRISKPENWCQGVLYREGQFCARGAVLASIGFPLNRLVCGFDHELFEGADKYLASAAREVGFGSSVALNNRSDHLTTYAMFDRARELRMADMMEMVGAAL